MQNNLTDFFNAKVAQYNQPAFIKDDPICVPHRFNKLQDIEIAGFLQPYLLGAFAPLSLIKPMNYCN